MVRPRPLFVLSDRSQPAALGSEAKDRRPVDALISRAAAWRTKRLDVCLWATTGWPDAADGFDHPDTCRTEPRRLNHPNFIGTASMSGAYARRSRLFLNQLHRVGWTKSEYGRVRSRYVQWIQPPRLVPDIHGALERLCRGQISESNTCVSTRRTHPRNRIGDYDAVGIARKYYALAGARLEGKCPEGVPPLATDLLIDVHLHRAGAIHDLVNGCAGRFGPLVHRTNT